jgi:hypothetical protein
MLFGGDDASRELRGDDVSCFFICLKQFLKIITYLRLFRCMVAHIRIFICFKLLSCIVGLLVFIVFVNVWRAMDEKMPKNANGKIV